MRTKSSTKAGLVPRPGSPSSAIYHLSTARTVQGKFSYQGDAAAIETAPEQWSYAIAVPVVPSRNPAQSYRIKVAVMVHDGAIGIGILAKSEAFFHQEAVVPRASSWHEVELVTPVIGEVGPLTVRNAFASGPSRARCRIAQIIPIDSDASSDFALRTLVDTSPSCMERMFAGLTNDLLLEAAKAMAVLKPLAPIPHWRFAHFERSSELAVHVRHSLWLTARLRDIKQPIPIPWHGGTRLALHLDNDLSHALFADGCFDPNEFALLDRVLQPGMVFLDGGANEGVYTVFASVRVGPSGRVLAVEPSRREIGRLRTNVSLNGLCNVEIVEAALAECAGQAELMIAERRHAGLNTLGAFIYDVNAAGTDTVTTVTLDELVAERDLKRLDIVKLDLEGAELRALSGAQRVLTEMKPLLLIELSDAALRHQNGSQSGLLRLLEEKGYVVFTTDGDAGEPVRPELAAGRLSDNIVAVHAARHWGLLA
jgi:FkbM family methyltransferase